MKLGIVGLPNVGKSTLFNAITKAGAESANYPFTTIDPNVGVVDVPDERLAVLSKLSGSKKLIPASIEFYDIAGLVKGASEGEGLGNKFLANIREVDAIVHVVRCFDDPNIIHVDGSVDPLRDIETINLELILSDLEMVERRIQRLQKDVKGNKTLQVELDLMNRIQDTLGQGKSIRILNLTDDEEAIIKNYSLLSNKPVIYAANVSDDDPEGLGESKPFVDSIRNFASTEEADVIVISATIENELSMLDDEDKQDMLEALGMSESGLDKLIKSSYSLLGLISFLTTGEVETRAWTIKKGTKAPQAASKIHSDIERGFIRAETINYEELIKYQSMVDAKDHGAVRQEGKEYVMQDGDVVLFRFNV